MKILDIQYDKVIDGAVAMGSITYEDALQSLVPLIDKTEFQRKLQDKKFYKKLERDLERGCVVPPITLAFITDEISSETNLNAIQNFVTQGLDSSFVLDGIQRLNTLSRLQDSEKLDKNMKLYINFIFCSSVEKLLYRMITLNNGQRPMTPRHQVEMMLTNTVKIELEGLNIVSEKEASSTPAKSSFKKSDIIQAYLAFMADSPVVDNKKIIEEKMDELLVSKIMSIEPMSYSSSFKNILELLIKFKQDSVSYKWLKMTNNLVGFCSGAKHSESALKQLSAEEFSACITIFDKAFTDFNPSRIKVGKYRRELACEYFKNFGDYKDLDQTELLEVFSELTND